MALLPGPQDPGVVEDALTDVSDGPHHFPHHSSTSSIETVSPPTPSPSVWILKHRDVLIIPWLSLSLSADNLPHLELCLDADGVGEAVHGGAPGQGVRVLQVNTLKTLVILI